MTTFDPSSLVGEKMPAGAPLPILMYHAVPPDASSVTGPLDVPAPMLRRQLSLLVTAGWSLLGQTEALAEHARNPKSRIVGVTFDDAYCDSFGAAEMVMEMGGSCTIYVPTAFVGTAGRLDWDSLRKLSTEGVELGSHSQTHRPMDTLSDADLTQELVDSRNALKSEADAAVVSFCYPHGYTSKRVQRSVARAGYKNACTVGHRIAKRGDLLLALPRLKPTASMRDEDFVRLVDQGEPGIGPIAKRVLTPGWRAVRSTAMKFGVKLT